ncbi:MAG: ATP-binding protein [Flavobacteriales bacterium]|nr:ATP-binding protein [Flavobacteriales bacterium]
MSFAFEIIQGEEKLPIKLGIYGAEGIGKTSLANELPDPLFIDTENGSTRINCRRIKTSNWENLTAIVKSVIDNPTICKTLVIDTLDKAESFCIDYLCQKFRKANIEDWGYGRGYTILQDEVNRLFELLNKVIAVGIHVTVIAHGKPRKFELPEESSAFDRWELKLTRQVGPLFKEWCDILLFCNYKTYVVTTDNNTKKAQGGKRVMYTTHHACWDAKNRFNLPDELELSYKPIAHLFADEVEVQDKTQEVKNEEKPTNLMKLRSMIAEAGITENSLKVVIATKGHYSLEDDISKYSDDFITRWIFPNWSKITQSISKTNGGK